MKGRNFTCLNQLNTIVVHKTRLNSSIMTIGVVELLATKVVKVEVEI
jgi:hypothetical protein